jgi:hypothetical protein
LTTFGIYHFLKDAKLLSCRRRRFLRNLTTETGLNCVEETSFCRWIAFWTPFWIGVFVFFFILNERLYLWNLDYYCYVLVSCFKGKTLVRNSFFFWFLFIETLANIFQILSWAHSSSISKVFNFEIYFFYLVYFNKTFYYHCFQNGATWYI